MKYYDGMGRDVTEYVAGLEKKIALLEGKLGISPPTVSLKTETTEKSTPLETVEEIDKPQTAKKLVKKVANTQ